MSLSILRERPLPSFNICIREKNNPFLFCLSFSSHKKINLTLQTRSLMLKKLNNNALKQFELINYLFDRIKIVRTIPNWIFFNIPGVAWAVLQTPLSMIHTLSNSSFSSKSSKYVHLQTVWARDQKFWENVHFPVTCNVSCVTCHMSPIKYRVSQFLFVFGQSRWATWWRVCYQWGLRRLVLLT